MLELNRLEQIGVLIKPPDIEISAGSGLKSAKLSYVVTDSIRIKGSENFTKRKDHFKIVVYGRAADYAQRYMTGGSTIFVVGRVVREYVKGQDGKPVKNQHGHAVSYLRIAPTFVQALRSPGEGRDSGEGATARPTPTSGDPGPSQSIAGEDETGF